MKNFTIAVIALLMLSCEKAQVEAVQETVLEPIIDYSVLQSSPVSVNKSNSIRVYVHYMPWFQSKPFSGSWGYHWTMNSQNPDLIDQEGKRQIASHYYPLIGPYDSGDPNLIEYHLLLMKYSGADGVLIDWYGSFDVYDYQANLLNSNSLIEETLRYALDFGVVYEEYTVENSSTANQLSDVSATIKDLEYIEDHYSGLENYISIENKPLLLTFGPRYLKDPSKWSEILGAVQTTFSFMPLWGLTSLVGDENVLGEFAWVDFDADLSVSKNLYAKSINGFVLGGAYPGFHDFYVEAGVGSSYGFIGHENGAQLGKTLNLVADYNLDYVQLITWNDFGEGTMLEPTLEFEYSFLEQIQEFTGVPYGRDELELITKLYQLRKKHSEHAEKQKVLDLISNHLRVLEVEKAKGYLSLVE